MVKIGGGSAFPADRILPGKELIEEDVDYLILESLAEITTVAAGKRANEGGCGYVPFLKERFETLLEPATRHGTTLITNGGAYDPRSAARMIAEIVNQKSLSVDVIAMTGDNCTDYVTEHARELGIDEANVISANAYVGAKELIEALEMASASADARVIIGGRIADPSLYVAPLVYEFDWNLDDWATIGQATVTGHLLECTGQVTGGFFGEPDRKPVPDAHHLGYPYAEINESGTTILQKPEGTGGRIDRRTCREQLFYEVHDPNAYLTPDVTADFTTVNFREIQPNQVEVTGGTGTKRPDKFKGLVGRIEGYKFECFQPYGGPRAEARAKMSSETYQRRLKEIHGFDEDDLEVRVDIIGVDALYGDAFNDSARKKSRYSEDDQEEVMLRTAGRSDREDAVRTAWREARCLAMVGAAAGGAPKPVTSSPEGGVNEIIGVTPVYLPRNVITSTTNYHRVETRRDVATSQ